jgi:hypothetical protein
VLPKVLFGFALSLTVFTPGLEGQVLTSGQSFAQLADLDPANAVGPRLTWTVTTNKLGNRLLGNLDQKITLIDAVASPPIVYEFASDAYWNRVVFSQKDVYIKTFNNTGSGLTPLRGPGGLDVSAQRTLFIVDRMNSRVVIARFDPVARTLTQLGVVNANQTTGLLRNVVDVAWDGRGAPLTDEYFYTLDADGKIAYWQWTGTSAVLQWTYGSHGSGAGQFMNATGICVGHQSAAGGGSVFTADFYVTDAGNRRVTWLTRTATGAQWPTSVSLPSDGVPSDCTVDHFGNVIVSDSKYHRLVKFNRPLWYVDTYGSFGVGPTSFNTFDRPHAIHAPFGTKRNAQNQTIWYGEGRVLTAERWTAQTGGLEHYLGIKASFTSAPNVGSADASISVTLTDVGYVTADVHRVGVGTVRTLVSNQLWGAGGNYGLHWDGKLANGTAAPADYYRFRVFIQSAYGCPNNFYTAWCAPTLQSQDFYFKYCPTGGGELPSPMVMPDQPQRAEWNPCNDPSPPIADDETADAPKTLFLLPRVVVTPQPLMRVSGSAGALPANATAAPSLDEAVRRYGVRGLSFSVTAEASGSPVKIRVYSAAGRAVRMLVNEQLGAGVYDVAWDGLDDGGRPVGPGVYVAYLTVGSFRTTQRLILRQPL